MTKTEAQKARDALKARQRDADLAAVMATPAGRRVLTLWLDELGGGVQGLCSAEVLQRNAALRDKALLLEKAMARVAPDYYRLLKSEQVGEHLQEIQLGD